MTAAPPARARQPAPSTNDTPGARRIADAFGRAHADGRVALIPYIVAGYPDAETSLAIALAAIDAGADLLEVGLPYSDPLADGTTLQRASAGALAAGATFDSSLDLVRRIARARPGVPLVTMGYANQLMGGGDGRERARALAAAGAAGTIVADLTPDEGRALRGCGGGGRGSRSSISSRRPPRPRGERSSLPGAAASSTACRSSGSPAPGPAFRRRSAATSAR